MKKKKIVVSFSGGKDSTLALYRMLNKGYEVIGLISTFQDDENTCFHKIPKEVLKKISSSLNIPLIEVNCNENAVYEDAFETALSYAKEKGAEICVFGDIDINHHRKWGDDRCGNVGMKSLFPLWNEDREKLAYEFLEAGFKAIIKKIDCKKLSHEYLGKELSDHIFQKIKLCGCDVCGENGEYHTIAVDGPIFSEKIKFEILGTSVDDSYGYLNISIL